MSESGHELSELTFLALGKQGRRVRLVHLFTPPPSSFSSAITLSTSPISKLRAADDERRQAKRNSLAGKLTVDAKTLVDLKIEKAAVEGERRTVDADLGPVRYLAALLGQADEVDAATACCPS
jgi:hypothetical protein